MVGRLEQKQFVRDELTLAYYDSGPNDGNAMALLVHGAFEFPESWHYQVDLLLDLGYRVMILSPRGTGASSKPPRIKDYSWNLFGDDVAELAQSKRCSESAKVLVIGHGFGGAIAWNCAYRYPDIITELVTLNSPHPAAYEACLRISREQRRRARSIFVDLLPHVAEWRFESRSLERWRKVLEAWGYPSINSMNEKQLSSLVESFQRRGSYRSSICSHRALIWYAKTSTKIETIRQPALVFQGSEEAFCVDQCYEHSEQHLADGKIVKLPGGSWLPQESPLDVNSSLKDWLKVP